MFDRFDIISAYYLFGSLYHGGQFTREYAYTGRALRAGFGPGASFSYRSLSENGKEIYRALVKKYKQAQKKANDLLGPKIKPLPKQGFRG